MAEPRLTQQQSVPQLLVLAGGSSSRMWPLREKLLIPFAGHSLLRRQLERLRSLGWRRAVLVASAQNAALLREELADLPEMELHFAIQAAAKGMGDAVLCAEPLLNEGPLFIHQVHDLVDDRLYSDLLSAHAAQPERAYLAAAEMKEYFPGGYLALAGERIRHIVEKPAPAERPSDLVNIVAHIHPSAERLCAAIRQQYDQQPTGDDHYERALAALMAEQYFVALRYDGPWRALKYPWHVLDVMDAFLAEQGRVDMDNGEPVVDPSARIDPAAQLSGPVVVAAGARVFAGANLVGPAYIGAGSIIGNQALVRGSMVGAECEVGFTSEVARSYVGDRCSLHACRVLDSVLAEGVNFSAGCTTANLRMDRAEVHSRVKGQRIASGRQKLGAIIGAGAFISVDAMTMPGVKIGAGAQIGPVTIVHEDVGEGVRLFVRQQQEQRGSST